MSVTIPEAPLVRSARRKLATGTNPYEPAPARIMRVRELTTDIRLYDLRFTDSALADSFSFRPGQFVELSVLGVGEGPFSLPSSPTRRGMFQLGIRRTGSLTDYLFDHVREGDEVGIRGPLGNGFPVETFEGQDMLLVAGGLGMVPLRGLLHYLIDQRERFGRVMLVYGTRSPELVLFSDELESLARRGDAEIHLSVEATQGRPWSGKVGVVTELLDDVKFDVSRTYAVACGPPVFYKFMLEKLVERGFGRHRIYLSLERRMECGIGKCGHCQINDVYVCFDGPVFSYDRVKNLGEALL